MRVERPRGGFYRFAHPAGLGKHGGGAVWGDLGASWGRLGVILGRRGGVGGPFGSHLGAILGPSWGVLGEFWGDGRLSRGRVESPKPKLQKIVSLRVF